MGVCPTAWRHTKALSVSTNLNPAAGYLDVPHSPLLAPPSITIEAWVKYDDATIPTGWVFPTIGRKNFVQGVAEWFLRVDAGNNNTKRLRLWVNGTNGICNVNWNFTAGQLANWTHVAATYDGHPRRFCPHKLDISLRGQILLPGPVDPQRLLFLVLRAGALSVAHGLVFSENRFEA